jgi:hypothetical protein
MYSYASDNTTPDQFVESKPSEWFRLCGWSRLSDWRVMYDDETDAEMVSCRDPSSKVTFMAFRGTESTMDAMMDVMVLKVAPAYATGDKELSEAMKDVRVHAGFARQMNSLGGAVIDVLDSFPEDEVVSTGHSLGGALATLGCLYVRAVRPSRRVSGIVFGCPRVGDWRFSALMDGPLGAPVCRHENRKDPVVAMPHRSRWRHCGSSIVYGKPEQGYPAVAGSSDSVIPACLLLPNPLRLSRHDTTRYVCAVFANMECEGGPAGFAPDVVEPAGFAPDVVEPAGFAPDVVEPLEAGHQDAE